MNKITVEITSTGWTTTVQLNGETFIEKRISTDGGAGAKGVEGNFEEEDNIPEELYDALNAFFPFECMQALQNSES